MTSTAGYCVSACAGLIHEVKPEADGTALILPVPLSIRAPLRIQVISYTTLKDTRKGKEVERAGGRTRHLPTERRNLYCNNFNARLLAELKHGSFQHHTPRLLSHLKMTISPRSILYPQTRIFIS